MAKELNCPYQVYVAGNASEVKIEKMRKLGADIIIWGNESGATEVYARSQANKEGKIFVSPYNDPDVVAGQGTIGIEILE